MHRLYFRTLLTPFGRSWACRGPSVSSAYCLVPHCGFATLVSTALGFGLAASHRGAENDGGGRPMLHPNLSKSSTLDAQSTVSLDKENCIGRTHSVSTE